MIAMKVRVKTVGVYSDCCIFLYAHEALDTKSCLGLLQFRQIIVIIILVWIVFAVSEIATSHLTHLLH